MAATITQLTVLLILECVYNYKIHVKLPEINETNFNERSHFKFKVVLKICENRDVICKSNDSVVCAMRKNMNVTRYKEFENICYLFLSNMCDYPGNEYYSIQGGTCEEYLTSRRNDDNTNIDNETQSVTKSPYAVTHASNSTETDKDPLRKAVKSTISTLYDIDSAYDYHACPMSCPHIYSPVCVNVNRGFGKYFKMLNFVNHCEADVYYCKHWREFAPPPDEDENVRSSPLSWSFCGASRYLQFARFAEVTSSLGHYGWLAGDYRYSHIMEPHERIPGFG